MPPSGALSETRSAASVRDVYDAMAPDYDLFTAHHDYTTWTTLIERLAIQAGLHGRRLLDVGCGTGKSFEPFLERGWEVTACDLSPGMLSRAAERAGGRARLAVHDLRELPPLGEFDLVCLLDDVVNHLADEQELVSALAGARINLAPGGVLVFDANTLRAYRSFFATAVVYRARNRILVWNGLTDPDIDDGGSAPGELLAWSSDVDGRWSLNVSRPVQHHHPRARIERALTAAGFGWSVVHGMQLDGSASPGFHELANSKALYLARVSAPPASGR
jgi:SAM-dependent methyltransferase